MLNIFKSRDASKEEVLNKGYEMALEFGKNWLQPINDRLVKKFSNLSQKEIKEYSQACEQLRNESNNYIYERLSKLTDEQKEIREKDFTKELTDWMRTHSPWVSDSNIKRTFNQGMYYAWKEGISNCVTK